MSVAVVVRINTRQSTGVLGSRAGTSELVSGRVLCVLYKRRRPNQLNVININEKVSAMNYCRNWILRSLGRFYFSITNIEDTKENF